MLQTKIQSVKQLQKEVDLFNSKYKVGDVLNIKLDSGESRKVTIRHEATILGEHTAVGWYEEIPGCYALSSIIKNDIK